MILGLISRAYTSWPEGLYTLAAASYPILKAFLALNNFGKKAAENPIIARPMKTHISTTGPFDVNSIIERPFYIHYPTGLPIHVIQQRIGRILIDIGIMGQLLHILIIRRQPLGIQIIHVTILPSPGQSPIPVRLHCYGIDISRRITMYFRCTQIPFLKDAPVFLTPTDWVHNVRDKTNQN